MDCEIGGDKSKARTWPTSTTARHNSVVIDTNKGSFTIKLDPTKPRPARPRRSRSLAKKGFFDGTTFHRIVPGLRHPGRRPDGDWQRAGLGTTHGRCPAVRTPSTRRASSRWRRPQNEPPGTSGSQFFVVTGADVGLPPDYAILGTVTDGLDVVEKIGKLGNPPTRPERRPRRSRSTRWSSGRTRVRGRMRRRVAGLLAVALVGRPRGRDGGERGERPSRRRVPADGPSPAAVASARFRIAIAARSRRRRRTPTCPLALLVSVAQVESNLDHAARSSAGASGLLQVMPRDRGRAPPRPEPSGDERPRRSALSQADDGAVRLDRSRARRLQRRAHRGRARRRRARLRDAHLRRQREPRMATSPGL